METTIRDPTTGKAVTDFDRDGWPIVNNIDHPSLFWDSFGAALIRSMRLEDTEDDQGNR